MTPIEFLKTILPEDGVKFLALARNGRSGMAHRSYETFEEMARAIEYFSGQAELNVYHACAAYKAPSYFDESQQKTKYRGEPNWLSAKAFWCDIDCGQAKFDEGTGYLDKKAGVVAITTFCAKHGLPYPMVVDSGGGLHCYWPLTESIGPNSWRTIAAAFKAALQADGVLADPTRTADLSSVLRPVGAYNRKSGREPRAIKVRLPANPVTPSAFAEAISKASAGLSFHQPREYTPNLNDDLIGHLGPQLESSAEVVAQKCAQVAIMRDTQGDVGYDHWRGVIGIIKHCTEGIELAEQWSARRAETGHSNTDFVTRYETWGSGPSTCSFFQTANPGGCEGCAHRDKIKSPIVLGRLVPEPVEQEIEVVTETGEVETTVAPPLPRGYSWDAGHMVRILSDKDGNSKAYSFSQLLFYPVQRVRKSDGQFAFTMRMHLPDQRVREFDVDTAAIAAQSDLLKSLSKYELLPTNNKDAGMHLSAYIRDSVSKLMNEQREVDTLTSFGWTEDMQGFLLGERLYCADGTMRRVHVGGGAAHFKNALPDPRGTLAAYSEAVNFVYNRPGSEAAQYAFCNTYGSLLTPFGEDSYNGLLVCIVSGKSGRGKTTVGAAARYGLGDAVKMTFAGKAGATWLARWATMGSFKNIPVVFDELTDIDAKEFSQMAYTISQGADRARMQSSGGKTEHSDRQTWAQSPDLTANEDLLAKLAQHNANTMAEAMRIIQINFTKYDVPMIEPASDVSRALEQMRANMGNAGDAFVKYIVSNQGAVRQAFSAIERKFSEVLPQPEYRFYRNHAACTMTAAKVLTQLGIVNFDFRSLLKFALRLIQDMIDQVAQTNMTNPADAVNRAIRELSSRVLVTYGYRDLRTDARGPEESLNRVVGIPVGRRVLGTPSGAERVDVKMLGKLFLSQREFREWCFANRQEPAELLEYAKVVGWLIPWSDKFNIGRGTSYSTGTTQCYVFDYAAMEGAQEATGGREVANTSMRVVASSG